MVLELPYLGAQNMQQWLLSGARTDEEIRGVFQQLLQGVMVLHHEGVVHADLKLDNVIIRDDGRPVIVDFDVSQSKEQLTHRTMKS